MTIKIIRSFIGRFCKQPNFIIIGVQKGGTTTLYETLKKHPNLKLSKTKEVHYYDIYYSNGLNWYKSFFPLKWSKKKTGEASPYYIFHPLVPHRLKKDNPQIKLIILLRNPILRAISHYNMERRLGHEPISNFNSALTSEKERISEDLKLLTNSQIEYSFAHQHYSYLGRSRYDNQIKQWFKHFDRSQMLFIQSENLFSNHKHELSRINSFLGIKDYIPEKLEAFNIGSKTKINTQTIKTYSNTFHSIKRNTESLINQKLDWD